MNIEFNPFTFVCPFLSALKPSFTCEHPISHLTENPHSSRVGTITLPLSHKVLEDEGCIKDRVGLVALSDGKYFNVSILSLAKLSFGSSCCECYVKRTLKSLKGIRRPSVATSVEG